MIVTIVTIVTISLTLVSPITNIYLALSVGYLYVYIYIYMFNNTPICLFHTRVCKCRREYMCISSVCLTIKQCL